jgi:death on curing protein
MRIVLGDQPSRFLRLRKYGSRLGFRDRVRGLVVKVARRMRRARYGGLYGMRDTGAIDSALARARNQWEYAATRHIAALAAAYSYGLTRSHGYSDGNKRVGFVAMAVFLDLNGWSLEAEEAEVVAIMLGVAAGEVTEEALAEWVREHIEPSRA